MAERVKPIDEKAASEEDRRAEARVAIRRMMEQGLAEIGERTWTREELHER